MRSEENLLEPNLAASPGRDWMDQPLADGAGRAELDTLGNSLAGGGAGCGSLATL